MPSSPRRDFVVPAASSGLAVAAAVVVESSGHESAVDLAVKNKNKNTCKLGP